MGRCKEHDIRNILCNQCDYPSDIKCAKKHMFRNLKDDLKVAINNDYEMEILTYDYEEYYGTICEFTDDSLTIINSVLVVTIIQVDDIKSYQLID